MVAQTPKFCIGPKAPIGTNAERVARDLAMPWSGAGRSGGSRGLRRPRPQRGDRFRRPACRGQHTEGRHVDGTKRAEKTGPQRVGTSADRLPIKDFTRTRQGAFGGLCRKPTYLEGRAM